MQLVKGPTRITSTTQTQIDLMFSNKPERITKSFNMVTGLSDHNLTLVSRKLPKRKSIQTAPRSGCFKIPKAELENFNVKMNEINWSDLLSGTNVEADCHTFICTIESLINHFQKGIKHKRCKKTVLPWINKDILKLMKEREIWP